MQNALIIATALRAAGHPGRSGGGIAPASFLFSEDIIGVLTTLEVLLLVGVVLIGLIIT